ncbi:MAG: hypothetical protein K0R17_1015 [Rariglobus sp.]|jgi:hypothetical protein|nr:hypothetical protein [Rariglobus sp.]
MKKFLAFLLLPLALFAAAPEAPPIKPIELWGTVAQVLPEGLLVQAKTNSMQCLVTGHPDQAALVDNAEILIWATEAGRYQYTDTAGVTRTVQKYQFKEKSKNDYRR